MLVMIFSLHYLNLKISHAAYKSRAAVGLEPPDLPAFSPCAEKELTATLRHAHDALPIWESHLLHSLLDDNGFLLLPD
jgi:hypothetical protein